MKKSEALERVNNKQDRTSHKQYNWAAGWIETSSGWYSVQDGELIHAQDSEQVKYDPDSWVNVSDMTGLTTTEYIEVKEQLLKWLKFDIGNKFI